MRTSDGVRDLRKVFVEGVTHSRQGKPRLLFSSHSSRSSISARLDETKNASLLHCRSRQRNVGSITSHAETGKWKENDHTNLQTTSKVAKTMQRYFTTADVEPQQNNRSDFNSSKPISLPQETIIDLTRRETTGSWTACLLDCTAIQSSYRHLANDDT